MHKQLQDNIHQHGHAYTGSGQEAKGHQGGLCPVPEGEQRGSQGDGGEGEEGQSPGAVHCQGKEQGLCTAVYELWIEGMVSTELCNWDCGLRLARPWTAGWMLCRLEL